MREFRPTDLGGGGGGGRERQKGIQGNVKKDLFRTQVPDPRLSLLGCLLALEKTLFYRHLLFPLHNAQVP